MAVRPWVTPDEVREYSERECVKKRNDLKLQIDIARAESYVINYTGNNFFDSEKYPKIPENIKLAVILIAESYAADAANLGEDIGTYKSENFDDYSYTLADNDYKLKNLDIGSLLEEFIIQSTGFTLKLRRL